MIDWKAIEQVGFAAAAGAVQRGLETIAARAKVLAPVRKLYGQFEAPYRTRIKTISEVRADRAIRRQLGLGPESFFVNPPEIVDRRAKQHLTMRRLTSTVDIYTGRQVRQTFSDLRSKDKLDRRGRYEYKTMRAAHEQSLGGRLREEIYAEEITISGKIIRGRVVSPTPYAKYQEYGTRHNPAHPYMRPAMHESRQLIRLDIGRSVSAAVTPLFRGRMEVVVKTRAR